MIVGWEIFGCKLKARASIRFPQRRKHSCVRGTASGWTWTFSKPQETGNNCIGVDVDAMIVIPGGHFSAGLDAEVELGRGEVWKPVGS